VPRGPLRAEFGPSLAHYPTRIKASVLERICSLGVRLRFGSLRSLLRQADAPNPLTSNTTELDLNELVSGADNLVSRYWDRIEMLSAALLDRQCLTGSEMLTVVGLGR
jgi:hypothetical protein